ncbi:MAG: polyisoprenoid-binding protein YceI [Neolewinella sp.]|jgi:polyisoprenoid-binding protein YceI|nr:YceI family protein [Lewinella sp.]
MKNFFFLITLAALFTACGGPEGQALDSSAAEDETTTTEMVASVQYNVDPATSVVNWEGAKIAYGHTGTVAVTNGQLIVSADMIVGGKFALDLTKMVSSDLEGKKAIDLIGHLQGPDFFDVEKYPMANFVITQVQEATNEDGRTHDITGNLTMHGESRSITIPAIVSMEDGMLKATTPKFTIDRTQWGVSYNSTGIVGLAKDKVINDNIGLEIMLVANK